MPASTRIVVPVTTAEKRAIVAKAKVLRLSTSEFMRRGALMYEPALCEDSLLEALAVTAMRAAESAMVSIDQSLAYINESNRRIALMEGRAGTGRRANDSSA